MAFFTATEQEVYEHKLRRTASTDRLNRRTHSRSVASPLTTPSPPSTHPQTPARSSPTPPPPTPPSNTRVQASQEPAPVARSKAKNSSPSRPSEASGPHPAPHASPSSSQDASIQPQHVHHPSSASDSRAVPLPAHDLRDRVRKISSTSGGSRLPLGSDGPHPHRYYASSSSSVNLFSAARPHISGNLSDAGTSSDRASSPLPAARLDVKRLLSKPAAPALHRTSLVDLSDSEFPTTTVAAKTSLSPQPPSRLPSPENRVPRPQPARERRSPVTLMRTPTSASGRQMLLPNDAHTSSPESAADRITSPVPHPHPQSSLSPSPSRSPSVPSSPQASPHTSPTTLSKTSFASVKESKDSSDKSKSRTGGLFRLRSRGTSGSGASGSSRSKTALAELLAAKDAQKRAETATQKRGHSKIISDIPYDLSWGRWSPPTPTASASLVRGSGSNSNSSSPAPSAVRERVEAKHKLTPAGAIMQAYKQQDERREQLVASVQGGDPLPGSSASSASPSPVRMDSDRARAQASPMPFAKYARHVRPTTADSSKTETPYFTLFGSSGRVVATGTEEDASTSAKKWTRRATVSVASPGRSQQQQASASAPPTVRKALTRKASGKLRRPRTSEQPYESPTRSEPEPSEPSPDANRPSLQERRSITLPKEGRKSLRLSIDDFVHIEPPEFLYPGRAATLPVSTPESAGSAMERKTRSTKGKEREREEEGVSRLWKLVKRLSTNGLRDKYQPAPPATPLPPVPAIPKDILPLPNNRELEVHTPSPEMTSGGRASATGRFLNSRTSMSGVRPTTAPASPTRSMSTKRRMTGASSSKAGSSSNPSVIVSARPSTSSSDLASARFFHRTSSRRSSSSSFDEIPPVPDLSNRILSPTELKRFDEDDEDEARAVLFSPAPPASPEEEHERTGSPHALPLPPRRIQTADRRTYRRADPAPSPDMPVFSITGTVNNFASRRPSSRGERSVSVKSASTGASARSNTAPSPLSDFGHVEVEEGQGAGAGQGQGQGPPPRPARSPHRPSPTNSSRTSSSAEGSPTADRVSSEPVTPVATLAYSPSHSHSHSYSHSHEPSYSHSYRNRDSMGTHSDASTARPVSPAATTTGPPAPAHLTFRELDSQPKALRTDQEKDRMWDDLMERSELAGGTLHLGEEDGLMSDRMRFSVSSVGSIM